LGEIREEIRQGALERQQKRREHSPTPALATPPPNEPAATPNPAVDLPSSQKPKPQINPNDPFNTGHGGSEYGGLDDLKQTLQNQTPKLRKPATPPPTENKN
jgi:hypothetical protein